MRPHIPVTLCLLLLAGTAQAQSSMPYEGGWEWLHTEYADNTIKSPATVGYTRQIQFSPDGSFTRYIHNVPVQESTWYFAYVWIGPAHVGTLSTDLGDSWFPHEDTLELPSTRLLLLKDSLEIPGYTPGPTVTEVYVYRGPVGVEGMTFGGVKGIYR